jgi:hypothetical protein
VIAGRVRNARQGGFPPIVRSLTACANRETSARRRSCRSPCARRASPGRPD